MLLTRIYLRNYRVYEDELELEIPPGLVGIYGPNGSGKSTLLEAVLFALWGKARTTKEQIRSTGVGGDCLAEVEFEHEGHLYLVRRVLRGINSTVSVEVQCDGLVMSTGTRDAERYVESVLGMDDSAFRASVFAEQKQLAAFSNQSPADRRRLVLQLLGVTPLDAARDAARRDARELNDRHEQVRRTLPDLAVRQVEAEDAEAKAQASEVLAEQERAAAAAAEERLAAAEAALAVLDRSRQVHESLVQEGKAARGELDLLKDRVAAERAELAELEAAAGDLVRLEAESSGLEESETELDAMREAAAAAERLAKAPLPTEVPPVDEAAIEAARAEAGEARDASARLTALVDAAVADADGANELFRRSESLSGEADCPVCGQALGTAFEKVQAHRAEELQQAEQRKAELTEQKAQALRLAREAEGRLATLVKQADARRAERAAWEQAANRHAEASAALAGAWVKVLDASPPARQRPALPPLAGQLAGEVAELRRAVERIRSAMAAADRVRGRLERRPVLEQSLADDVQKVGAAEERVEQLRVRVRELNFDRSALQAAETARDSAASAARASADAAREAALGAATQRERASAAAQRLADAQEQHAKLAGVESEARHVSRVADLLSEFRNTVVASVGPRLSLHAAQLFSELTDHEYDELLVDPETYQLQISDGGRVFGLERFSGSEVDLANLALRVAISEHIHFQSGGSVGLLVLDEVFGPLDEDRKARMLLALERLRGRFRQVLVVTHDSEIKEQLPGAIEVVKLTGRRAAACVVGGWGD
ncbi:MAG TPA: SMC family ATPase [Acidimicrobiales bacterium]